MTNHEFPNILTKCANCGGPTIDGAMKIVSKRGLNLSVCGIRCRDEQLKKLKIVGLKVKE